MDATTKPAETTLQTTVTGMGLSLLKALPTSSRMHQRSTSADDVDFEAFASNTSRVFTPPALTVQFSE